MSIRKLKNGKWEVSFRYEHPISHQRRRFRKWSPFRTKAETRKWEEEQKSNLLSRNWHEERAALELQSQQEAVPTLEEFLGVYLERAQIRASSKKIYRSRLNHHVIPRMGGMRLNCLEQNSVDAMMRELAEDGLKPTTIRGIATAFGSLLSYAIELGYLSQNGRPNVKAPPLPSHIMSAPKYLTDEEVAKLKEAAPDKIKVMVELALRTGLRVGELQALRWSQVNDHLGLLNVNGTTTADGNGGEKIGEPKGGSARTIPLTKSTLSLLTAHANGNFTSSEFVFSFNGIDFLTRNNLRSPTDMMWEKSGIEGRGGWHCMRHTFAARLATEGVALHYLQRLLGHKTIKVTERYASLMPQANEVARDYLEALGL